MKRGAWGNVAYGGNVNPPHNRKGGSGNPPSKGRRAPALSRPLLQKRYEKIPLNPPPLPELIHKVAHYMGLNLTALLSGNRDRNVSTARAVISYLGAKEAGYTQTEIENHLNISRIGVRNCILRGEKMIDKCQEIWQQIA